MEISEKIRELRTKEGLSQEELAEKVGVSRQSVSKWESGQATPEISKLLKLSTLFNVSSDMLIDPELGLEDDRASEPEKNHNENTNSYTGYSQHDKEWFLRGYIRGKKILLITGWLLIFFIELSILSVVLNGDNGGMLMILPLFINATIIAFIVGLIIFILNKSRLGRYGSFEETTQLMKEESKAKITGTKWFKAAWIFLIAVAAVIIGVSIYATNVAQASGGMGNFALIEFSPTFAMNIITILVICAALFIGICLIIILIRKLSSK